MHEEPPPPTTVLSSPCPHLTIAGNRPNQRVRRRPTLTDNCPGQRIRPHPTAKNLRIAPQHSRHGRNLAVPKATAPTTVSPSPRPRPTLIDNRPSKNPPPPDSHRQPSRPKSPLPLDSEKPPRRITTLSPRPQLGLPKRNCLHNRFTLSAPSPDTHRQSPQRKVHHPTAKSLRIVPQHSRHGRNLAVPKSNRPNNRFALSAPSPDSHRQPPQRKIRHHPTLAGNRLSRRVRRHPTAKNFRVAPQHSRHGRNLAVPKAPPRQPFHPLCALARHSSTIAPAKIRHHPTLTGNRLGRRVRRHPTAKSLRIASQHSHPGPHPGQLKRNRPDNRFILFAPSPDTRRQSPPAQESATTRHSPATASAEKSAARQRKASHRTTTLLPRPHHSQPKRNRPDNRFTLSMPSPDTHGNRPSEKFAVRKKYEIFGPEFGL